MLQVTIPIALLLPSLLLAPIPPERASRILSARNLGLAQLEEGKTKEARKTFERLAELLPDDALPYADGAVAAMRESDHTGAEKLLALAVKASGERADLVALRGALEEARNRPDEARAAYAKAASLDPRDLESRWRLVRSVEATPTPAPPLREARRRALAEILAASPTSLPARLKLLLADLDTASLDEARKGLERVQELLGGAEPRPKQLLSEAVAALGSADLKTAGLRIRVLENLLRATPRYQQSLGELFTAIVGLPVTRFGPALEEALRPRPGAEVPVTLKPGGGAEPPEASLRRVDLQNSGKASLYSPPAPHSEAVFLDFDLDGDLDPYLLGAARPDALLRNNLDGTFADVTLGTGEPTFSSRRAVPVDVDRDGDLDLVCIDATGSLAVRSNLRQGRFRTAPAGVTGAVDVAAEDLNGDGAADLAVATKHGVVVLINKGAGTFRREESPSLASAAGSFAPSAVTLADLDNDGFPDLVVAGSSGLLVFRRATAGSFAAGPDAPAGLGAASRVIALDTDADGDLDLVLSEGGRARVVVNEGGNANGWVVVVLEGLATGSGKVNRAGLGSTVEVKAGDLFVARTVGPLPLHLGLGPRTKADVVRVLFTNGIPQNAFDVRAKATLREVQMLKGSCPFVYAHDGRSARWSFVSDALGRAPLGLLYDGVSLAGADTREWLAIDGSLLSPTPDGKLLLDYTEELWEAAYLDETTLMVVDHPEGTQIVPNERMVPHPLERKLFTVARPRPVRGALSTVLGETRDVRDRLARRDGAHVEIGPETYYQGRREEHALELDLGPLAAGDRVVLFLHGWIFYTDTSINVSMSQRKDLRHFPPLLEVPDGRGGWRVALESFGFPAGKSKTMPVDLTGIVNLSDPRVRLRTTSAIFWDHAFVTVNDPAVPFVTTLLSPAKATLGWRGFSRRYREPEGGPELFDHSDVSVLPAWEDVPGLVTRYGDVTELLRATDDRYVVFRGGDAIRIEYDAASLPPLPPGVRRDYVLVSDGWDKDFDKNTVTGQSYEPWPFHAMPAYPYPETEGHPHPEFLREWMTRGVGPGDFRRSIDDLARGDRR